jgi:hypothetical protein
MKLARAEWSRLFARRFTRIMLALILLVLGVVGVAVTLDSKPITAADHARAKEQVAQQVRDLEREAAACQAAQARGEDISQRYPPGCDFGQAQVEERWFLPYQFDFKQETPTFLLFGAGILALFGFVVGASFVGAEWTSGAMTNLLLWRPRRLTVLATKLLTMLAGVTLMSAVYVALWIGAFWFIGRYRGTLGGALTAGFWQSLALTGTRTVALCLVSAAAGFALASLGRHTAMALGAGIGYALVVEVGSMILFGVLGLRDPERWRLSTYVIGWLIKKYELARNAPPVCGPKGCQPEVYVITWGMSGAVMAAILAVLLAGAFVSMRRRDVA